MILIVLSLALKALATKYLLRKFQQNMINIHVGTYRLDVEIV